MTLDDRARRRQRASQQEERLTYRLYRRINECMHGVFRRGVIARGGGKKGKGEERKIGRSTTGWLVVCNKKLVCRAPRRSPPETRSENGMEGRGI